MANAALAALLAGLPLAAEALAQDGQPQPTLPTEPLSVVTDRGPVALTVEIADDGAERSIGMMFRTELPLDRGMLFDMGAERPVAFWMANTLIPLDMLFIDAEGRVVNLIANAEPETTTPRQSDGPVVAVLELAGGAAARLGIDAGDQVCHRLFEPLPGACG